MKVRLRISIASPEWSYAGGQVVDLPVETAEAWIENGVAEPAGGEAPIQDDPQHSPARASDSPRKPRQRK